LAELARVSAELAAAEPGTRSSCVDTVFVCICLLESIRAYSSYFELLSLVVKICEVCHKSKSYAFNTLANGKRPRMPENQKTIQNQVAKIQ
jgi:hypothetical protein